jgi:hypothetical protein
VDVLTAFRHRPDVQVFGLMNLAKLEFPEDSDSGAAHPGGLAALGYALNVLPAYEDNEAVQVLFIVSCACQQKRNCKRQHFQDTRTFKTPNSFSAHLACEHCGLGPFISFNFVPLNDLCSGLLVRSSFWLCVCVVLFLCVQGSALMVLAVLADNFSLRRELFKEDWVTPTVAAVMACETDETELWVDHGGGRPREKTSVKRPTRHAVDTCAWACQLVARMACDSSQRAKVADDGVALALRCLHFAGREHAVVAINACKAVYNCVYRCEAAHVMATEEDALACVEPLLELFSGDDAVQRLARRTVRALQPDGWRGAADDTGPVVGGRPEGNGANEELAEGAGEADAAGEDDGAEELTEWSVEAYAAGGGDDE